jgi:hypothetical protein
MPDFSGLQQNLWVIFNRLAGATVDFLRHGSGVQWGKMKAALAV